MPSAVGAIEHSTRPSDIVLRYDVGGGLIATGFSASHTPIFTLYGDGTIVFKDIQAPPPPSRVLSPAQVEALGVTPFTGGFQNLVVQGPDTKLHAVEIRPLLPDETE